MSILIMSEVWQHAPVGKGDLLVLLRIADAAGDDHRMMWEAVTTIAKRTRMSERSVYNSLRSLEEMGIIETVAKEDAPREAILYRSVVRRIRPVEDWLDPSRKPVVDMQNLQGCETGAETDIPTVQNLHPADFSSNPYNPIGDIEVLRTSGAHALHEDNDHRPGSRGWAAVQPLRRGGRKSKKQIAEEKAQAELELDPAYVVSQALAQEAPAARPSGRLPASDDDLAPPVQRTRKPRSQSPAEKLANYFAREAKRVGHPVPGSTNKAALARNLRRWMAEFAEYGAVVKMIDLYWSPDWQRSDNVEAWKDFQNQRGALTQRLAKSTKATQTEANRYDESAW